MKEKYASPKVRRAMYAQLNRLMEAAKNDISAGNGSSFYDADTHYHLMASAWEIMFPLKKELWPESFNEHLADKNLPWPQGTTYAYSMGTLLPPFINCNNLYFGYAVLDDRLIRTTFYAIDTLVKYQVMPQSMVIDPLGLAHGIQPDYYIGCLAEKRDIKDFLASKKNPLEAFVNRKDREEYQVKLYDTYLMAYALQLEHEPAYFPPQLIEFCREHGLYVPDQAE